MTIYIGQARMNSRTSAFRTLQVVTRKHSRVTIQLKSIPMKGAITKLEVSGDINSIKAIQGINSVTELN